MKILSIVGARPQFIKQAVIQSALEEYPAVSLVLVHTGQHYDCNMSDIFFKNLRIKKPNYHLSIAAQQHGEMTGRMLIELEKIIIAERPDVVLVHGDTNSTLAGALAAVKLNVPIAHVEAGLRQEPASMPEEINRRIVDKISSLFFAPSELAVNNLQREGHRHGIFNTGDVMYDLYLKMSPLFSAKVIQDLQLKSGNFVVMTLHRDFNVDHKNVLEAILFDISLVVKEMAVVFPLHPRTKKRIGEFGLETLVKDVHVLEPIGYLQLMGLTEQCYKVVTDSGGYQKEAYFAGKQACVVMPDTSWRELIDAGQNVLCQPGEIHSKVFSAVSPTNISGIYGDGNAARQIARILTVSNVLVSK